MFTTAFVVVAAAGALVQAAPVAERAQPSTYYTPYLEPYDTYHLRYLALDCQDKHNTTFFKECCRPMLGDQQLSSRPDYCTPNTTEIASASAYIASTSVSGAPAPTGTATAEDDGATAAAAATTTTSSADSEETSIYSVYSAAQETTTSSTAAAAPTTQAAIAQQQTTTAAPAPTTTSTTAQAAPTTQASNGGGNTQTGGFATYFYQGGNAGACGTVHSDSDAVIAIDQAWWSGSFGQQSSYCGKWITVKNNNNGKTVNAMVADVCPTCANGNSLDLSVGAFTAIASEADGMVPITWWFS